MAEKKGFFAYAYDSNGPMYRVKLVWKTNTRLIIDRVAMTWVKGAVSVPYAGGSDPYWGKNRNFLEEEGRDLGNGEDYDILVTQTDLDNDAVITFNASAQNVHGGGRGGSYAASVILPKQVLPEPSEEEIARFAVESYCENNECTRCHEAESRKKKISADFLVTDRQIDPGSCGSCGTLKNVRFAFRNCQYQVKGKKSSTGTVIEYREERAGKGFRYFYPYADGRDYYGKVRVITKHLED